ncbi:hypothetical protein EDD90_6991 [Streptomyces sp. Ag109_O5-1]|nr:hypothetical protein [Streptomyces sp. Ag109_O5-1]RPE43776.1 hypothetical protein EDD90_6991 [Streptomyces sp. Ag109_O5-1]
MERHRTRRGTCRALLALTTTGALLLAGCGADDEYNGPNYTGLPAPPAPSQAQRNEAPEATPSAPSSDDDLSTFALDVESASCGYGRRTFDDGGRSGPPAIRAEGFATASARTTAPFLGSERERVPSLARPERS